MRLWIVGVTVVVCQVHAQFGGGLLQQSQQFTYFSLYLLASLRGPAPTLFEV
jgi:hypothetical protein